MLNSIESIMKAPSWILITVIGLACILLGASQQVVLGTSSIQLESPYNIVVITVGVGLVFVGVIEFRQRRQSASVNDLPVKKVKVTSIERVNFGSQPIVRVSGNVSPPIQGVKVWILREHASYLPGHYHVGANPAFTDQSGSWQQNTNLWSGSFRIYAVVASDDVTQFLEYYRECYVHARNVYREKIDKDASTFPGWPFIRSLPSGCILDDQSVVIDSSVA